MNIEEIMKPYFDKKEEIERKTEINNKYIEEKNLVSLRLERLRDNKDREIEEYVQNAVADRPDFYAGYGAMIRKDLEQAYSAKEQELENQIKALDEKMDANSKELSRYHRVDVRELIDVKHGLRKELIAAKKDLELKLKENQIQLDTIMLQLSTFKYEYDENHNVLNGNEYRELFEQSNSLIDVKYSLQRDLNQLEEYLKITELTEEEVKTVMMSMTDWEKEEYDRRKAQSTPKHVEFKFCEELEKSNPEIASTLREKLNSYIINKPELVNKLTNLSLFQPNFTNILSSLIKEYPELSNIFLEVLELNKEEKVDEIEAVVAEETTSTINDESQVEEEIIETTEKLNEDNSKDSREQTIYEQVNEAVENEIEREENYSKFIDEVTDDVLMCVKKLRTVEVQDGKVIQSKSGRDYNIEGDLSEEIELPNGLYLNRHDIERAARNYKRQSKGRTFTVKGIDSALNITRKSVKKVKEVLRKCSLRELLNEKKISIFDVKRVYGKEEAEKYSVDARNAAFKTEDYVKVQDVLEAFKELFVEKTPTWLEKLTSKFRKNEVEEIVEVQDAEYQQVEDEISWNAEEPEYEVIKARTK